MGLQTGSDSGVEFLVAVRIDQVGEVFQSQAGEWDLLRHATLRFESFRLRVDGFLVRRTAIAPLRCA